MKNFLFTEKIYDAIQLLPDGLRGKCYEAIIHYGLYGEIIEDIDPVASAIIVLIEEDLDEFRDICISPEDFLV